MCAIWSQLPKTAFHDAEDYSLCLLSDVTANLTIRLSYEIGKSFQKDIGDIWYECCKNAPSEFSRFLSIYYIKD